MDCASCHTRHLLREGKKKKDFCVYIGPFGISLFWYIEDIHNAALFYLAWRS